LDPKCKTTQEKPILKMIHRYNLADLNLANRTANQPAENGFKGRKEIVEKANWVTTS
jgi:hypothetical protein